jgi:hypothetical protein
MTTPFELVAMMRLAARFGPPGRAFAQRRAFVEDAREAAGLGRWWHDDVVPFTRDPTPGERRALRGAGWPEQAMLVRLTGGLKLAMVEGDGRGGFCPVDAPRGELMVVISVFRDFAEADAVAFAPNRPGRVLNYRGAEALLGLDDVADDAGPVRLYPTPLAWLKAGGDGIAPATTDRAELRRALWPLEPRLHVSDELRAARVRRLLDEPPARRSAA